MPTSRPTIAEASPRSSNPQRGSDSVNFSKQAAQARTRTGTERESKKQRHKSPLFGVSHVQHDCTCTMWCPSLAPFSQSCGDENVSARAATCRGEYATVACSSTPRAALHETGAACGHRCAPRPSWRMHPGRDACGGLWCCGDKLLLETQFDHRATYVHQVCRGLKKLHSVVGLSVSWSRGVTGVSHAAVPVRHPHYGRSCCMRPYVVVACAPMGDVLVDRDRCASHCESHIGFSGRGRL